MPDTALNQASYPQSTLQKAGLGFPVMRIVGIISLGCGAVLDWAQGACSGKLSGETAMLRQLDAALGPGDILLMDRYYTGYFTVARLLARVWTLSAASISYAIPTLSRASAWARAIMWPCGAARCARNG